MPRPAVHAQDAVLDAARDLILSAGPRAVGVRAIAARSGAPSGSLYHRFSSRDELVAQAWLRAVRRFQDGFLQTLDAPDDPREAVGRAAARVVTFALRQPADARLLLMHSRQTLLDGQPSAETAAALRSINDRLNARVRALARRFYGRETEDVVERVSFAIVDLPLAAVRRHLVAGTLTPALGARLARAARDLLSAAPTSNATRRSG